MKKIDIAILLFSLITFIFVGVSLFKIINAYAPDFAVFYKSAEDLLRNINPYSDSSLPDSFIYPVATGIFYIPFALLPYKIAQGLFVFLSAISVPFIILLSLKALNEKFSWRHLVLFTSLAYLSFPVKFTLGMGQSNLLALFLLSVGIYFYKKKLFIRGGVGIGFAYLLKPILGISLLFFILTKAWKTIAVIFISTIIIGLFSAILFGPNLYLAYSNTVVPSLLNGVGNPIYYNQSFAGFMARLSLDNQVIRFATLGFNFLIIAYTVYLANKKNVDDNILLAIIITLIPLIHTLSWQHHFVVLTFPFIAATMKILKNNRNWLLGVLFVSYVLVSWNIKELLGLYRFPEALLLSHVFYGTLLLYFLNVFILNKNK